MIVPIKIKNTVQIKEYVIKHNQIRSLFVLFVELYTEHQQTQGRKSMGKMKDLSIILNEIENEITAVYKLLMNQELRIQVLEALHEEKLQRDKILIEQLRNK